MKIAIPYKIHPAWASDSPHEEGKINVESGMANTDNDDCPVVEVDDDA